MLNVLAVMAGGALGSLARFLCGLGINRLLPAAVFPWATFTVNILGCFFIGLIAGIGETRPVTYTAKVFLITGILGGFTTFSAFGLETFTLMREGHTVFVFLNVASQLILGILAVGAGFSVASRLVH